jgi:hypothetical protein
MRLFFNIAKDISRGIIQTAMLVPILIVVTPIVCTAMLIAKKLISNEPNNNEPNNLVQRGLQRGINTGAENPIKLSLLISLQAVDGITKWVDNGISSASERRSSATSKNPINKSFSADIPRPPSSSSFKSLRPNRPSINSSSSSKPQPSTTNRNTWRPGSP